MLKESKNNKLAKSILLLLTALITILLIAIIIIAIQNNHTSEEVNNNPANADEIDKQIEQEETEMKEIINSGVNNYISHQKSRIESATTDEEKAEIYLTTAWELYEMQTREEGVFTDEIFKFAKMAEQLNPTAQTAYELSIYEKELGDPNKSQEYYNLAIDRGLAVNIQEGVRNDE